MKSKEIMIFRMVQCLFSKIHKTIGIEMTLVPLIYTSLIIFSSLLFFVITVSYLSYKVKSRHRKKLPSERLAIPTSVINSKPIMMNNIRLENNPPQVQATRFDGLNRFEGLSKQKSGKQPIMNERKENRSYTQVTVRQDYFREKEKDLPFRDNEKTSLRATRLKIMNESNSFRKTSEYDRNSSQQNYDRDKMVETNLFSYYDNSQASDFELMDTSLFR